MLPISGKLYRYINKEIYLLCFPDNSLFGAPTRIQLNDIVLLVSSAEVDTPLFSKKMKFVFLIEGKIRRKHGNLDYFVGPNKMFELIS